MAGAAIGLVARDGNDNDAVLALVTAWDMNDTVGLGLNSLETDRMLFGSMSPATCNTSLSNSAHT